MLETEIFAGNAGSSSRMSPRQSFEAYQNWGCSAIASLELESPDLDAFSASWTTRDVAGLQLLVMKATPLRVFHCASSRGEPSVYQILMPVVGTIQSHTEGRRFSLKVGEFSLLSNQHQYEHRVESLHHAIDLIVPAEWLERWLPMPEASTARPIKTSEGWGAPFGRFLTAMADEFDYACLPEAVLADQLGALLALALGPTRTQQPKHREKLLQRVVTQIREKYCDPNIDPEKIAQLSGISKRYLHALLGESGTTFLELVGGLRQKKACELLLDRRFASVSITEIAWRCGYSDPNYFSRVFRSNMGKSPREWRKIQGGDR